ncbi:20947_t:CDS:1, partial [Rhizophagus irregularis]
TLLKLADEINHSKQDKQQSKKNNLPDLQEDHIVILDDISFELIPMQSENLLNENLILLKCYRVEKKVQDQICLLISNNWWYSWAYKKTKNITKIVIIDHSCNNFLDFSFKFINVHITATKS